MIFNDFWSETALNSPSKEKFVPQNPFKGVEKFHAVTLTTKCKMITTPDANSCSFLAMRWVCHMNRAQVNRSSNQKKTYKHTSSHALVPQTQQTCCVHCVARSKFTTPPTAGPGSRRAEFFMGSASFGDARRSAQLRPESAFVKIVLCSVLRRAANLSRA